MTLTRTVALLGLPMDLGAGRRGVDMGPSALRLAGLAGALRRLGHEVVDLGNVDVPPVEALPARSEGDRGARHADAIADATRAARRALDAVPAGALPVVLGGDHAVAIASVAHAAAAGRTGVLWVDAHADLNTPATSPSGNVHGMPLAVLLGDGDAALVAATAADPGADAAVAGAGHGRRPASIRPEDVVLLGVRSLDDGERRRVRELGIRVYTMSDVDRRGMHAVAVEALASLAHVERLHVSLDADALDPSVAPGVGTPVVGGLTYREAHLLMELIAADGRLASADLVEVNPTLDVHNQTARVMVELSASLMGQRIL